MEPSSTVPLIIGANVGAAGFTFVATIRKRGEALRLALATLLLQAVGAIGTVILALIPIEGQPLFLRLVEWVTPGALFSAGSASAQHVATVHTLHNLIPAGMALFWPGLFVRLTDRLFGGTAAAAPLKPHHLDRNLIRVPSLALRQANAEVVYTTEACRKMMAEAFDAFRYGDIEIAEQVTRRAEMISGVHREVSLFLLEVSRNELNRSDASQVEVLQSTIDSLSRIAELAERFRELTARKSEEQVENVEDIDRDMNETYDLVMAQFANILSLLRRRDARTEESAVKLVEKIAKVSSRVEVYWRQRLEQAGDGESQVGIHLQTMLYQEGFNLLLRAASQLAHVATRMRLFAAEIE